MTGADAAKKVIDVVDLSDEEDSPPVKSQQPGGGGLRVVPASQLQAQPTAAPNVMVVPASQANRVLGNAAGGNPIMFRPSNPTFVNLNTGGGAATVIQRIPRSSLHPAPLPTTPVQMTNPGWKLMPPRPTLKISRLNSGKKFHSR